MAEFSCFYDLCNKFIFIVANCSPKILGITEHNVFTNLVLWGPVKLTHVSHSYTDFYLILVNCNKEWIFLIWPPLLILCLLWRILYCFSNFEGLFEGFFKHIQSKFLIDGFWVSFLIVTNLYILGCLTMFLWKY